MENVVFQLKDDLVACAVERLQAEIKTAILASGGDFALDFREVIMIDSKGLGLIITLNKLLIEKGRKFILLNLNQELKELLALTRLDMHLVVK